MVYITSAIITAFSVTLKHRYLHRLRKLVRHRRRSPGHWLIRTVLLGVVQLRLILFFDEGLASFQDLSERLFRQCLLADLKPAFEAFELLLALHRALGRRHHYDWFDLVFGEHGACGRAAALDSRGARALFGPASELCQVFLHACRLAPVFSDAVPLQPMLPLQMLHNPLFCQLGEWYWRFLPFSICFHLLNVRFLFHSALRVVLSFFLNAPLHGRLAQSHVVGLTDLLKGNILGLDVIVCGEAALLHLLEHILLVEGEDALLEMVFVLEVQCGGRYDLGWVKGRFPLLHGLSLSRTWRQYDLHLSLAVSSIVDRFFELQLLSMGDKR